MRRITFSGLARLACALVLSGTLSAQVLRVHPNAPSGGNGSSWGAAFNDLQAALAAARANASVTEVWVAAGRYIPHASDASITFLVRSGVGLYGGFAGGELARDERDPVANPTLLDGDLAGDDGPNFTNYDENSQHVVESMAGPTFELDGFTVRGGRGAAGAGVRSTATSSRLANLVLEENSGRGGPGIPWGGGAWVQGESVSVTGCTVRDNTATTGAGLLLQAREIEIRSCSFARNAGTGGCAISVFEDEFVLIGRGSFVVDSSTFEDHQGTSGAAISLSTISPWDLEVDGSAFRDGSATSGGGIRLGSSHGRNTASFRNSVFEDNVGCTSAGIFLGNADVSFTRCVFANNGTRQGCGIGSGGSAMRASHSTLDFYGCVFANNTGPAVWLEDASSATLAFTTFSSTDTRDYAVRVTNGVLDLEGCILWGPRGEQVVVGGGSVNASYSDVHMGGVPLSGPGNLDVDPLFVNAAAGDVHLAAGSPCIEAGNPVFAIPGADFERDSRVLDGDLDGAPRIDVGADEFGPIHLEILGVPQAGNTLTLVTSGAPGLSAVVAIGLPGLFFVPKAGSVFLSAANSVRSPWAATPSSVPVLVPAGLSGLLHVQEVAFGGGAVVLSNYVPLQF